MAGVKGIAYVGALNVLEDKRILDQITRVGGTSAGAITATLVALGYTPQEIEDRLAQLDFKNFRDHSWGYIRDVIRLLRHYGWYKGEVFKSWIAKLIEEKTGDPKANFAEIHQDQRFLDLYLIGTNVSTGFAEVFSKDHTPDTSIAEAVRISMSIPLFFAARRNEHKEILVDGGVLDNYPIKLFDRKNYIDDEDHVRRTEYYNAHNDENDPDTPDHIYNQQTLGFRLDSREQIAIFLNDATPRRQQIKDLFGYAWRLVATLRNVQEYQHLHSDDWHRTIYIKTLGVGTTEFNIPQEKKDALIEEGRKGTKAYFKWYDDPDENPSNRPEPADEL